MIQRILRSRSTYVVLSILLLLAGVFSMVRVQLAARPEADPSAISTLRDRDDLNIVFILIDTLRADRLGMYGYERDTSPAMDRHAANGIRFARASAQSSWTKTSMASLWTGLFPPRNGILRFDDRLPDEVRMPAEILREEGYRTAGIWRNGWVAPNFGFGQGFDTYLLPAPREDPSRFQGADRSFARLPGTDEDVTLAAIEFLRNEGHSKFLLYLHYMDVHQYVYDEKAAELPFGASLSDVYDRAIHWTDRNVDAVLATLEELGLSDRTIVVIASDHGEGFFEHGEEGHARTLYEEVTHVPFVIIPPFRLREPLVVEAPVRNVDVWPTILDLVGLGEAPMETDGVSLVDSMLAAGGVEGAEPEPLTVYSYLDKTWGQMMDPKPLIAIREGDRKVLFQTTDPEGTLEVFDLGKDPGEKRNLSRNPPVWSDALRADLDRHEQQEVLWTDVDKVELDDLQLGQLRALGYVVDDAGEPVPREER